jgi:hypothetical protein
LTEYVSHSSYLQPINVVFRSVTLISPLVEEYEEVHAPPLQIPINERIFNESVKIIDIFPDASAG